MENKPHGTIAALANYVDINESTLRTWTKIAQKDPTWRPDHHRSKNKALTLEAEDAIIQEIYEKYIDTNQYLPRIAIITIIHDYAVTHRHQLLQQTFRISKKFLKRFLDRNGLSIRCFHKTRRPPPNDTIVASFLQEFEQTRRTFLPNLIINADETNWLLVPDKGLRTIAKKGVDGITCYFNGNLKDRLTVMAAIALDGAKLPLLIICKGKTERCEKKFQMPKVCRSILEMENF